MDSTCSRRLFLAAGPARMVFGALSLAAAGSAPAAVAPDPDAALLRLDARLAEADARQRVAFETDPRDEVIGAINHECAAICEEIAEIPAAGLPGLRVKARAIVWCVGGEEEMREILDEDEDSGRLTTERIVRGSLYRDLLDWWPGENA